MTTEFTEFITTPGQRWDSVAYATLDDPFGYQVLIEANPAYRDVLEFSQAVTLRVPVVAGTVSVNPELLPPWRR
ncbi:MAG: hypothetical protein AAFV72_00235 [Cyanobacteria bacterium J06635_1]